MQNVVYLRKKKTDQGLAVGKTLLGWGNPSACIPCTVRKLNLSERGCRLVQVLFIHLAYIIYKNIHIQSHVESKGSMS